MLYKCIFRLKCDNITSFEETVMGKCMLKLIVITEGDLMHFTFQNIKSMEIQKLSTVYIYIELDWNIYQNLHGNFSFIAINIQIWLK